MQFEIKSHEQVKSEQLREEVPFLIQNFSNVDMYRSN